MSINMKPAYCLWALCLIAFFILDHFGLFAEFGLLVFCALVFVYWVLRSVLLEDKRHVER
jgi:hypothetical protein